MSKSKTAAAAEKAVAKSNQKSAVERTTEQIIADACKNYAAGLSVTYADQKLILSEYDRFLDAHRVLVAVVVDKDAEIARLNEKLQEFRDVYEQENRTAALRVDVLTDAAALEPWDLDAPICRS